MIHGLSRLLKMLWNLQYDAEVQANAQGLSINKIAMSSNTVFFFLHRSEVLTLEKELKIRNEENQYHRRTYDVAHKQYHKDHWKTYTIDGRNSSKH
nr:hypothetical protein [Tanacetum cinerariifolium]